MTERASEHNWGVLRYAYGDDTPELDGLHSVIDGWYDSRETALTIYEEWVATFPDHVVVLVQADQNIRAVSMRTKPSVKKKRSPWEPS